MNRNEKLLEIRKKYARLDKTLILEMLMSHINRFSDEELNHLYISITSPNPSSSEQISQETKFKVDF